MRQVVRGYILLIADLEPDLTCRCSNNLLIYNCLQITESLAIYKIEKYLSNFKMESQQISVKVYYVENKNTKEIRRFAVDEILAGNFEYIVEKIHQVFPDLIRKELELFWKDEEDDYISISTNEELCQVLRFVSTETECLKLFVKAKENEKRDIEHPGIVCDGCDRKIYGVRYKCTVCDDYDLCTTCNKSNIHLDDHKMMSIEPPQDAYPFFPIGPKGGFYCNTCPQCQRKGMGSGSFDPRCREGCHRGTFCDRRGTGCHRGGPFGAARPGECGPTGGSSCQHGGSFDPKEFGKRCNLSGRGGPVFQHSGPFMMQGPFEMGLFNCYDQSQQQSQKAQKQSPFSDVQENSVPLNSEKIELCKDTVEINIPENFCYIDNTLVPEPITECQIYDQKLEKAIKQMEAMGFDNESGWLKQLLIAKDLNIGKVLDAINPSI